jgi:hypothetical protein
VAKFLLKYNKKNRNSFEDGSIGDKIRQFLVDNNEVDDLSVVERFWRTIEKLKVNLKIGALNMEGALSLDVASGVRLSEQVDVVEKKLVEFANELGIGSKSNSFYLMVDQIERIWSNDPGSDALAIGLLRAAKFAQGFYNFVNCIVFFRVDIYEKLNFPERDKLRSDEFFIKWGRDDLIGLVEARAAVSTENLLVGKALWTKAFPRMVGDADVRKYLSGKTLSRPRDIIQICNACRDVARAKARDVITQRDILVASGQYSRWKLVDIQNEWNLNYSFLADALLLISNGSYLFAKEDFERKFDSLADDLRSRYPESKRQLSSDLMLTVLFFIGVIGAIRKSEPLYFHECEVDERLRVEDQEFVVHPGFREALQCTSAINLTPFEQNAQFVNATARSYRSRFRRQSITGREEAYDSLFYITRDLGSRIADLKDSLARLHMSSQIMEEIRTNLVSIEDELVGLDQIGDGLELRDTAQRMALFFRNMERGLIDRQILSQKSDFAYKARQISDLCLGVYSFDGGPRPFNVA